MAIKCLQLSDVPSLRTRSALFQPLVERLVDAQSSSTALRTLTILCGFIPVGHLKANAPLYA